LHFAIFNKVFSLCSVPFAPCCYKDLAVKKNLDLLNEFRKYAFENPEVLERIPPEAELIILPTDDPELSEYNRKTADKILSRGKK